MPPLKCVSAKEIKSWKVFHLGSDSKPVAAADVGVNLEAHVVGDIVLPHVHQRIQGVLAQPDATVISCFPMLLRMPSGG